MLYIIRIAILGIIILFLTLYKFSYLDYTRYIDNYKQIYTNDTLTKLINANPIYNLPNIKIQTNNKDILQLKEQCKSGIVYLGNNGDLQSCLRLCGSTSKLVEVHETDEIYVNNKKLTPGFWCTTLMTKCNLKTGYILATVNGVTCRTKYPNMFGGETCDEIIACNNSKYPTTGGVLFDYRRMEPVNTQTIQMNNENELLDDNRTFRFQCKYTSNYLPHPLNRFHPIKNPCTKTIYRPHPDVQLKYINNNSWRCDCGNFLETRVRLSDPENPQSTCSSCYFEKTDTKIQMPYSCFTLNSLYPTMAVQIPCFDNKFINEGNMCDVWIWKQAPIRDFGRITEITHSKPPIFLG